MTTKINKTALKQKVADNIYPNGKHQITANNVSTTLNEVVDKTVDTINDLVDNSATKTELANIGLEVSELVGGSTTTDHSNDTYTEAKAWKFADGTISAIDASQAKSCAVNAISLNKNQKITIKTATYSTNIKAYIVIGTDGTLIKSQSISATYSVEVFDYTAESACSVYINRLADKDFSCVVTTAGDGGKIATIESNISTLQSTASATSTNVGNLTELSTTEKSNLVKAINEIASKEVDAYSKSQSDNKYASKNISESLGDTDFDCQDCELTTIKKGGIKGALGTYDNNTTSSVMKCVTSYIDVDGYDKIVFRGFIRNLSSTTAGYSFYSNSNESDFLSGSRYELDATLASHTATDIELSIPTDAKYFRFTFLISDESNLKCKKIKGKTIAEQIEGIETNAESLQTQITILDTTCVKNSLTSPYCKGKNRINSASANGWYSCLEDSFLETLNTTTTYASVISLFDTLVDDSYVKKNNLGSASGTDADGNSYNLYEYVFKPRIVTNALSQLKTPKILLTGCLHGFEKCAAYGLFYFAKDLVQRNTQASVLSYLRNNVEIHIIPIVNAYGFDNNSYTNANSVNINRNFPCVAWADNTGGGTEYHGVAPLDQPESKIIESWINSNSDAMLLADCHTNGRYNASSYPQANNLMTSNDIGDSYYNRIIDVFVRHIQDQSEKWSIYGMNPALNTNVGIIQLSATGAGTGYNKGVLSAYVARYKKTIGITLEGFNGLVVDGEQVIPLFSDKAKKINAENIGNLILQFLCEYAE